MEISMYLKIISYQTSKKDQYQCFIFHIDAKPRKTAKLLIKKLGNWGPEKFVS